MRIRMRCWFSILCVCWPALLSAWLSEPGFAQSVTAGEQRVTLPQLLLDPAESHADSVLRLDSTGDLQAALDQAEPGAIIELAAGAIYKGPFILPSKPGDQWITIRSSAAGEAVPETGAAAAPALPAAGIRVTPAAAVAMARLESAAGPVVMAAPGAHHYRFIGIEISPARPTNGKPIFLNALVVLGSGIRDSALLPHHIMFERCYFHGDPIVGARRAIELNSASTIVRDSWFADFMMEGADSQALVGWAGPGPYRIVNNYLEGAGENLMFGGGDPLIANLVPSDIEIRGNHFSKPIAWRAGAAGNNGYNWTIKNLLELKNARRVLIDGNLFEYNWPQAQNGYSILFTVRNQEGTAPWSTVEDVTFSNNIVRHIANGINLLGRDDNHPSQPARRIHIYNNLFMDLGGEWGDGNLFQVLDGVDELSIVHNTAVNEAKILNVDGRMSQDFVFLSNIVWHNEYGISGTGAASGSQTLAEYFNKVDVRDNLIIGGAPASYPSGNNFPRSSAGTGFTDASTGDFRLLPSSRFYMGEGDAGPGIKVVQLCAALSITEQPDFCN